MHINLCWLGGATKLPFLDFGSRTVTGQQTTEIHEIIMENMKLVSLEILEKAKEKLDDQIEVKKSTVKKI